MLFCRSVEQVFNVSWNVRFNQVSAVCQQYYAWVGSSIVHTNVISRQYLILSVINIQSLICTWTILKNCYKIQLKFFKIGLCYNCLWNTFACVFHNRLFANVYNIHILRHVERTRLHEKQFYCNYMICHIEFQATFKHNNLFICVKATYKWYVF